MARPRMLMSAAGPLMFTEDKRTELLDDVAEVINVDTTNRAELLAGLQPGGKYAGAVGVYNHWTSPSIAGPFNTELVNAFADTGVKWIAGVGAGYDMIDIATCKARGILYSSTPSAVDDATATTALYLLLSALRGFAKAERDLRAGGWKRAHNAGHAHDLEGRTLAILGLGGIGLRLAAYVRPFGVRVVYHSRRPSADAPPWCEYFPAARLDEMLALADVLSVHVPLREDTVGFVGERVIRTLKKGAILINTARGRVVDEDALIRALEDGHLGGVGLDVYPDEPHVNTRLLEFPNMTLLPHAGAFSADAAQKLEMKALVAARDFLTTGTSKDVVVELR